MLAPLAARLAELERRFELLRRLISDLQTLADQLRQRAEPNRAPTAGEDRLAKAGSSIAAGASGSLTYYKQDSVTALTDPAETVIATNPNPTTAVPNATVCIVGVVNGKMLIKGWYC